MSKIVMTLEFDSQSEDADLVQRVLSALAGSEIVSKEPARDVKFPAATTTAKTVAKDLNPIKEVPPAPNSTWDRGNWVNLRSTGFAKYVKANLDTFGSVNSQTDTDVRAKWKTLYDDAPFPGGIDIARPEKESPAVDPEPDPDATGEKEPVGEAEPTPPTVGTLMGNDQKTDDTSLPEESSTQENTESLFGS